VAGRFPFHLRAVSLGLLGEAGMDGHSGVQGRVAVMTPHEFVSKWRGVELKERSASQSHFARDGHALTRSLQA